MSNSRPVTRPIKKLTPEEQAARDAESKRKQEEWAAQMEEQTRNAVPNTIVKLREEAAQKLKEAENLECLQARFPNLRRYEGRWKKVAYYSREVNSLATGFDMRHNCGCCNDSPLEIWPYLETPEGKVYSDPACFKVGEKHWMGGDRPYDGWRDTLKAANIPDSIIEQIAQHFKDSRQERIDAASDDGDYEETEPLL